MWFVGTGTACSMNRLIASLFAVLSVVLSIFSLGQEAGSAQGKTIIILDASGSMWGQIEGRPKIEIAREVIADLIGSLNPDLELGLMAYGHREKGNCDDIELLVPPATVDRDSFLAKVNSIIPKGMTPLTDAVEQAAGYLAIEENAANVILVSDGLETCDRDPCVLAGQLAARGIAFKTHIVAFDLTSEEAATIKCLADETGGTFLQAQDAATLKDALEIAVEAVSMGQAQEMPAPKLEPATVTVPESVRAGASFEAGWQGPDNRGDYLTIVAKGTEDGKYDNYAYTRNGSPVALVAPIEPGPCEVRYMAAPGGEVLGRADILVTPVEAALKAPAEVVAGAPIPVEWTGPDNRGDYVTIVPKGAEEGSYQSYAYTRNGSPAEVRALPDPGPAELRYVTGQGGRTLVSIDIVVTEADVIVSGPESIDAGDAISVSFKGPKNQGDYLTVVLADAEEGKYNSYAYAKNEEDGVVSFTVPEEPGEQYEIRYVEGQDGKTLASAPLTILPITASVSGPETAVAGSEIEVEWFGPRYRSWYITIVEKGAEVGTYKRYFYTKNEESPTMLETIEAEGPAEIRYMSAKGNVVASVPIEIVAAKASFSHVPEKVAAGEKFRVEWEGPDNRNDWVTIVKPEAADGEFGSYIYPRNGHDQELIAPEEPGEYEIRYVTGQEKSVLARAKTTVVAE